MNILDVTVSMICQELHSKSSDSRDRLVVRTLRCGRSNPGSNPGHGNVFRHCHGRGFFFNQKLISGFIYNINCYFSILEHFFNENAKPDKIKLIST